MSDEQTPAWVPGAVAPALDAGAGSGAAAVVGDGRVAPGQPPAAVTEPLPAVQGDVSSTPIGYPPALDEDDDDEDEDEPWPSHAARRGVRLKVPTAVLLVLLVAAGAFWGGAAVQRGQGSSLAAGAGAASRLRSLFGSGAAGAGSASPGSGAAGSIASRLFGGSTPAATGTVTAVIGNTLYVTNSSGNLVKVTGGPTTTVTRNSKSTLSGLKAGDTVVVEGTTAKNGTVTASSIAATAEGTSAGSLFGGRGGASGAGGAASSSAGAGSTPAGG